MQRIKKKKKRDLHLQLQSVSFGIYWLSCVLYHHEPISLWACDDTNGCCAWFPSHPPLPLLPGCALHFFFIVFNSPDTHVHTHTRAYTHSLCNLFGWATQCEFEWRIRGLFLGQTPTKYPQMCSHGLNQCRRHSRLLSHSTTYYQAQRMSAFKYTCKFVHKGFFFLLCKKWSLKRCGGKHNRYKSILRIYVVVVLAVKHPNSRLLFTLSCVSIVHKQRGNWP